MCTSSRFAGILAVVVVASAEVFGTTVADPRTLAETVAESDVVLLAANEGDAKFAGGTAVARFKVVRVLKRALVPDRASSPHGTGG